jgi:hypothetical protein
MGFNIRDIQARCAALGHSPGKIDGMQGPKTRKAIAAAMEARGVRKIPRLFGPERLHRIVWHWTAGAEGVISLEKIAYNCLVDHKANRHDGKWRPEHQADYRAGHWGASHTRMSNTGCIGISCDAMAGAVERPFHKGSAPLLWPQIFEMCHWTGELCVEFDIPVSKFSTLMHSEVQPTLGIQQKWKWDMNWLPDMNAPGDPITVGDRLREFTQASIDGCKDLSKLAKSLC